MFPSLHSRFSNGVIGLLACLLLAAPDASLGQEVRVENVEAYQTGDRVIVEYDLLGNRQASYEVDLRLSRSGGDAFDYAPSATSGAVGTRVSAGRGKEIVWSVLDDFPDGLTGDDYQFKVIARREGPVPSQQPTAAAESDPEPQQIARDDGESFLTARLGVGLAYNTRETVQVQYYDGYQVSLVLQPTSASISLKANYRNTTGTFKQTSTLDFDVLYNGSFYYVGTSAGMYDFDGNVFKHETNSYNLSGVAGLGFSLGSIYPYLEYRLPFSRGQRDDVLSGGLLYSF